MTRIEVSKRVESVMEHPLTPACLLQCARVTFKRQRMLLVHPRLSRGGDLRTELSDEISVNPNHVEDTVSCLRSEQEGRLEDGRRREGISHEQGTSRTRNSLTPLPKAAPHCTFSELVTSMELRRTAKRTLGRP